MSYNQNSHNNGSGLRQAANDGVNLQAFLGEGNPESSLLAMSEGSGFISTQPGSQLLLSALLGRTAPSGDGGLLGAQNTLTDLIARHQQQQREQLLRQQQLDAVILLRAQAEAQAQLQNRSLSQQMSFFGPLGRSGFPVSSRAQPVVQPNGAFSMLTTSNGRPFTLSDPHLQVPIGRNGLGVPTAAGTALQPATNTDTSVRSPTVLGDTRSNNDTSGNGNIDDNKRHEYDIQTEADDANNVPISAASVAGANAPTQRRESRTQTDQWTIRLDELKAYRRHYGTCSVPHNFQRNIQLALWVKRQRYQFKLKYDGRGRKSTLSDEREQALNEIGFVWDSHQATWEEKWSQLVDFKKQYGHTNVPITATDEREKQLAVWVKCQRRQFQIIQSRGPEASAMSQDRIDKLNSIGFQWSPRKKSMDIPDSI